MDDKDLIAKIEQLENDIKIQEKKLNELLGILLNNNSITSSEINKIKTIK